MQKKYNCWYHDNISYITVIKSLIKEKNITHHFTKYNTKNIDFFSNVLIKAKKKSLTVYPIYLFFEFLSYLLLDSVFIFF